MDDRLTRMMFATAALAAVAAVLASPAGASDTQRHGARLVASQAQSADAVVVPYLSHGVGVDETRFSGQTSRWLADERAPAPQTIPYLSQGVGVDESQLTGQASSRLTGVHAALLYKQSPSSETQPLGLTGDGALTRVPGAGSAPTAPGGNDIDWTSFGAGAGMAALVAAGLVGILLTVRRRHTVGMP